MKKGLKPMVLLTWLLWLNSASVNQSAQLLQEVGENPKVLFDVLVDVFGLTIGLWVVGCRSVRFYAQELQQIPHEVSFSR
jgi:hypothetical protein